MSLDLDIKITPELPSVSELLRGCGGQAALLNGYPHSTEMVCLEMKNGKEHPVSEDHVIAPDEEFILRHKGCGDDTVINIITVENGGITETWAGVSVFGAGGNIGKIYTALTAALFFSEKYDSPIYDELCVWSRKRKNLYSEMLQNFNDRTAKNDMK